MPLVTSQILLSINHWTVDYNSLSDRLNLTLSTILPKLTSPTSNSTQVHISGKAYDQLHAHMSVHTGEWETLKCSLCEKAFKTSAHLSTHKRIHTGYKPYKCLQCDMAFREPAVLKKKTLQNSYRNQAIQLYVVQQGLSFFWVVLGCTYSDMKACLGGRKSAVKLVKLVYLGH